MAIDDLTAQRLRDVLSYCPDTGIFTRRHGGPRHKAGAVVGSRHHSGYLFVSVDGLRTGSHRLAWLYMTGSWPVNFIDHINGVRDDNRFCNLRDVDRSTNNQNQTRAQKSNKTSGMLGVYWEKRSPRNKGVWIAKIGVNNRRVTIGRFESASLAQAAYLEAKSRLHGR